MNGLVYNGGYTRSNMFGLRLDYRSFVKKLVQVLLAEESNRVMLVSHTIAPAGRVESDPDACRAVWQQVAPSLRERLHIVEGEYDQHELKGLIGMCDFFVGSRMHACIAALSQGIPTVGIAYSRKFHGVFETVGAAACVIDGRTEETDSAIDKTLRLFAGREVIRPALQAKSRIARENLGDVFARMLNVNTEDQSSDSHKKVGCSAS